MKQLEKQRFELIYELSENIALMSGKEADSFVTRASKLEVAAKKLKQKHFTGLMRTLNDANVFKYHQIETKLDGIFEHGLTSSTPLVLTGEDKLIDIKKSLNKSESEIIFYYVETLT